jgi:hypothetical protein
MSQPSQDFSLKIIIQWAVLKIWRNVANLIKTGGHKNTFEKYYTYNGTKNLNQINDTYRLLIIFYWYDNIGRRQLNMLIWSPCFGSKVFPRYPVACRMYCCTAPHLNFGEVILSYSILISVHLKYNYVAIIY